MERNGCRSIRSYAAAETSHIYENNFSSIMDLGSYQAVCCEFIDMVHLCFHGNHEQTSYRENVTLQRNSVILSLVTHERAIVFRLRSGAKFAVTIVDRSTVGTVGIGSNSLKPRRKECDNDKNRVAEPQPRRFL